GAPYFTRAHVSAIELGKIRPAMRSLEHMAKKLDKPASYFLDDADAERARSERELDIGAIAGLLTFASADEAVRRAGKLLDMGEPQRRTTYYQQAVEWSSEIGDLAGIAFIHQWLGNAYRALGDHDAAAGHYQRALASAELGKDLVGVLVVRNALAVIAADAGR